MLWGVATTLIQLDEYGLSVAFWILSGLVLISKAVHWNVFLDRPGISKWIRVGSVCAAVAFAGLLVFWTKVKKEDKPWSNLLERRMISATLDVVMYTDSPSASVQYNPPDPTTQLFILSEKTLYTINSATHITVSNLSQHSIGFEKISIEINCGKPSSNWTKLDRVDPAFGKLVTHSDDGSPYHASILDFPDLDANLSSKPLQPGESVSGLAFTEYPEDFTCDSRNPRYRIRLTGTGGHEHTVETHGGGDESRFDRIGRWKKLIVYGDTVDVTGFKTDRY